ncbi:MAG: DNA translocase FtsK [Chthoniobacteraceae bacterium]|nr:DNA translocase FtsK [Chthoniobacteraceae bacterium]
MSREPENRLTQEVVGLILLGAGTLLFLALISYDSNDVPGWFPLSHSATGSGGSRQTIFGMTGAILACISNFFLGSASFFLAVVLFGYGAVKLICPGWRILRRTPWAAAFILSAATLAHFRPSFIQLFLKSGFLEDYANQMHLYGPGKLLCPGGLLGYWLGRLFQYLFDRPGSLILLTGLYLASMVLMTGIHPVLLIRKLIGLFPALMERYRQWQLARADEKGRLELERKHLEQETRKLEKQLKRKGVKPLQTATEPEEEQPPGEQQQGPEFDPDRPAPQVIDTQAARAKREREPKPKPEPLVAKDLVRMEDYQLPGLDLLDEPNADDASIADPEELLKVQALVIDTLAQFGVAVAPGDITRGPTITRYEIYPAKGVSVDKVVSRERDIARATRAERINILAPIPGKDTVGIEIANSRKQKVAFRELMESDDWTHAKGRIPLVLGKDVYGKAIMGDLAAMPHLLVAGATGSGKSVCINSIIASILYRFKPEELRFIMIDPKVVEMQIYNTLPHLVIPVVTDPKKVLLALRWVIDEMEKRYKIFAKTGVRNITSFNARPQPKTQKELDAEAEQKQAETAPWETSGEEGAEEPEEQEEKPPVRVRRDDEIEIPEGPMSYIVVIIDELADLMQTAPADVESAVARITQMARAAGIHMIVATQTPRAEVITGVIKANIPSRIAFQVASGLDSRIILDEKGAERLLGQGDMLYQPPGTSRMTRAQGVLVTDDEIRRIVEYASSQGEPSFNPEIHERLSGEGTEAEELSDEDEELVQKCIEIMKQEKKASTSLFQRRLRLGYTRAARVVDILEQRGYVAAGEGAKPREILVDLDELI